jgi:hypothetical protein
MSSQTRDYRSTHPGFENNLFCNIYAKYAKYAKCTKYVIYVIYAEYAKYVMLVFNLGGGGMRFPAVWQLTCYGVSLHTNWTVFSLMNEQVASQE